MRSAQARDGGAALLAFGRELFVRAAFRFQTDFLLPQVLGIRRASRRVRMELPSLDFPNARGNAIQKIPVVRDDDVSALIGGDKFFQPAHRFDIEMIGRLVQNQILGIVDEQVRERGFCALSAGEFSQRTRERGLR